MEVSDEGKPHATIGFVIYYPFHFYVYKNIYKHLLYKSEFIIDTGPFLPAEQPQKLIEEIVALLNKEGVPYRLLRSEDYQNSGYLERFFKKYEALVTVWHRGCVVLPQTAHIKKINAVYGVGKELNAVRPAQSLFDIALVYGERAARMHEYFTHPIIVGNPKFDDWFDGSLDEKKIAKIQAKLDSKKKTLLYLPTHSDLSSIDQLAEELYKISELYNIVVKPHYFTRAEEPKRIELLSDRRLLLFNDEEEDLLSLLKIADIVLSDNSSAIFDAVLADKPVVVADFWDKEFLDFTHKESRNTRLGKKGAATFSDSIEQTIKRDGIVPTVRTASDLKGILAQLLSDQESWGNKRRILRDSLFSFRDGSSGKRAAQAIEECIADTTEKKHHIVFHAVKMYAQQILATNKNSTFYSILFLHTKTASEANFSVSIRALIEQNYPAFRYEIFVIGCVEEYGTSIVGKLLLSEELLPRISYISETGTNGINIAIQRAVGTVVCFTDSQHLVPSNWIEQLHLAYNRFPDSAGVGGYVAARKENYTLYDEYIYYKLGKKLGVEKESFFLSKLYEVTNNVFSQNPAGDLSNMSYKKSYLPLVPSVVNGPALLANYIKATVVHQCSITFMPLSVVRQDALNRRRFLAKCRDYAFAATFAGRITRQRTDVASFLQLCSEPIQVFLRYRKVLVWKVITFSIIVFLEQLYEQFGKLNVYEELFKYKLEQKLKDTEKSLKSRS